MSDVDIFIEKAVARAMTTKDKRTWVAMINHPDIDVDEVLARAKQRGDLVCEYQADKYIFIEVKNV